MNVLLQCTKCRTPLPESLVNRPELEPCPACGVSLQVEVFPALFRRLTPGRDGEALLVDSEASCFYHPQKKAVVPCEGCGRFLCALCDCELRGQHFCPGCLESGKKKGRIKHLEDQRTRYDNIALSLTIYPLLIFYFTIITAPMALYVALRFWNAPRSIVHRTRLRLVLAVVFATLQIAGWGVGAYFLTTNSHVIRVEPASAGRSAPVSGSRVPGQKPGGP
jgi:hypothetical protein